MSIRLHPARAHVRPTSELAHALRRLSLTSGVGAPSQKRKAAGRTHDGLSSDSAEPVRLVALSRLLATREDLMLGAALQTPTGQAVAAAVQALVLRVAAASGVAAAALDAGNVQSLFNLSASHVAQQRLYDGGLMLPSRLPHANAKRLLAALLDALTAERATVVGHRVAQRLLQVPAPAYDAEAAAEVAALMAAVEQAMEARLGGDGGGGGGSSGGSGSGGSGGAGGGGGSTAPNTAPSSPGPVEVSAVELPSQVISSATIGTNARLLLEGRLARPLTTAEAGRLQQALAEALSLAAVGGAEQQFLLASPLGSLLIARGGAFVWAAVVAAISIDAPSVEGVARALLQLTSDFEGVWLVATAAT